MLFVYKAIDQQGNQKDGRKTHDAMKYGQKEKYSLSLLQR